MLEDRENERQAELNQFSTDFSEANIEVASSCPILEGIYRAGGAEAIVRLCNFSPRDITILWTSARSHVVRYWNVGRGKRSQFAGKDVFFMLLVVMKCGGTWETLSNIFQAKTPSFIKTILGFLEVVTSKLYDTWVAGYAGEQKMRSLVTAGHTFQLYPCALYATDVTFQQANRLSCSMAEAMPWYSASYTAIKWRSQLTHEASRSTALDTLVATPQTSQCSGKISRFTSRPDARVKASIGSRRRAATS
ncbi:hypothetical protein KRP22_004819 [Phytophthora ramorum]|nr:hypothetical protein KRP22_10451 [Phytophthora ramorum]